MSNLNLLIYLSIFLMINLLTHTTAQSLKKGPCPKPKPMKDFEAEKFTLLWYEFFTTPLNGAPKSKCTLDQHYKPDGKNWPLTKYWVEEIEGKGIFKFKYSPHSTITGTGVGKSRTDSDYTYLETDYETYASVFLCKDVGNNMHNETLYILTGSKIPDQNTFNRAVYVFVENDIDVTNIKKTDLSGCPDNWDDAMAVTYYEI